MLTRKQQELLVFIQDRLSKDGISPSFDEMKDALDLRSKSGIHRLITALEERGFIRRLANRARAIEVIKLPELGVNPGGARRGFTPSVIEGNLGKVRAAPSLDPDEDTNFPVTVPVMGRIAAGTPIEALQTATIMPARAMKLEADTGSIEVGKRADMVVLDANPLDAITNVRTGRAVVANGTLYDCNTLWTAAGFRPR